MTDVSVSLTAVSVSLTDVSVSLTDVSVSRATCDNGNCTLKLSLIHDGFLTAKKNRLIEYRR